MSLADLVPAALESGHFSERLCSAPGFCLIPSPLECLRFINALASSDEEDGPEVRGLGAEDSFESNLGCQTSFTWEGCALRPRKAAAKEAVEVSSSDSCSGDACPGLRLCLDLSNAWASVSAPLAASLLLPQAEA
eukprot:scaffold655014_cov45-Prasinocladus_malaysianus.AAC.1